MSKDEWGYVLMCFSWQALYECMSRFLSMVSFTFREGLIVFLQVKFRVYFRWSSMLVMSFRENCNG